MFRPTNSQAGNKWMLLSVCACRCAILSLSKLIQWMKRWTNKKLINRLSVVNPICREDVGLFSTSTFSLGVWFSSAFCLHFAQFTVFQFKLWDIFWILFFIWENLKEFGRILYWWASFCRARWQSQSYRSYKVIEVFRKYKVFTLFTVSQRQIRVFQLLLIWHMID